MSDAQDTLVEGEWNPDTYCVLFRFPESVNDRSVILTAEPDDFGWNGPVTILGVRGSALSIPFAFDASKYRLTAKIGR